MTIDDKTRPLGGLAGWQHKKLAEFIEAHLDEEISVHHLAEIAQLSRYHFGRAFTLLRPAA
jgi:AraC family transcriptional regulator